MRCLHCWIMSHYWQNLSLICIQWNYFWLISASAQIHPLRCLWWQKTSGRHGTGTYSLHNADETELANRNACLLQCMKRFVFQRIVWDFPWRPIACWRPREEEIYLKPKQYMPFLAVLLAFTQHGLCWTICLNVTVPYSLTQTFGI